MLFLNTKMYSVKTPSATLGLLVMKNTQICDSLPWTRMSLRKKVAFKESFITLNFPLRETDPSWWGVHDH